MNKTRQRLLNVLILTLAGALTVAGQGIKLTPFVGYTIQDKVYGYYGDMTVGDGMHFGGVISKEISTATSVDLTYSYQSTSFGVRDFSSVGSQSGTYSGSVSYLMIGSTHSPDFTAKVAPYGGVMLGAAIFSGKEGIISETWKFAVGMKLGAIYHVNDKFGIVIQTQLMIPVQGIGVGVGCGGGGCGSGVSTSSSATQLGFTGGVEVKLGELEKQFINNNRKVMRNKVSGVVMLICLGLLLGCAFEGAEYTEDLDLVATNYAADFDFASKGTYFLPDTIWKVTGDLLGEREFVKDIYAIPMLAKIEANMNANGWTRVASNASPDIRIVAAWTSTTIIYGGYGSYYCWYYPYYCGGYGWYYPYYPTTSYSTGTLLMTMVDPNNPSTDDSLPVVWTAAVNGLLSGAYDVSRITKGIDQTFNQSPYLKTN